MYLGYGEWIIERLLKFPKNSSLAILIRHSERPDFNNIPINSWNSVLLTQRGEEVATEFGAALVSEDHFYSVNAYGWGLERCTATAKKIVEGAVSAGSNAVCSTLADFQSPIQNLELYNHYLQSGKYLDMIENWFSTDNAYSPFHPYTLYSKGIISRIVNECMQLNQTITVIVTHDLHILPILNDIFGGRTTEIGFMDGIIISKNGNMLDFFSRNSSMRFVGNDFLEEIHRTSDNIKETSKHK